MSIQRWNPWREMLALREAMNDVMTDSLRRFPMAGDGGLEVDLQETDDSYIIKADVPGFKPEDIDVSLHQNMLRIRADRHGEEERTEGRWLIRERRSGHVERTVSLPESVRSEQAEADFSNGVLTITMPKREDSKPRPIEVRSGGSQEERSVDVATSS